MSVNSAWAENAGLDSPAELLLLLFATYCLNHTPFGAVILRLVRPSIFYLQSFYTELQHSRRGATHN